MNLKQILIIYNKITNELLFNNEDKLIKFYQRDAAQHWKEKL
jgi:hypothetical protein